MKTGRKDQWAAGRSFRAFGELRKVEPQGDGTIVVRGIASTETVDSDGEVVTADAMRKAIPDYMRFGAVREMHGDSAAGTALSIGVNDDGETEFEAHIVDPVAVKKCLTGVYKGFSVGGRKLDRDQLNKRRITAIKLTEISLVDRPSNPDAVFELAKFDAVAKPAPAGANEEGGRMDGELDTLRKNMYDVGRFAELLCGLGYVCSNAASEAIYEGDASPVPAKIKAGLVGLADAFKAMAAEEVDEMLASLKVAGVPDVLALAAEAEDLRKRGAQFSKQTKDKLAKAHDHIKAASAAMDDTGYAKDDGDGAEDNDAKKGEGLAKLEADVRERDEKLAKLEGEAKQLGEKLAKLEGDLKERDEKLAKAEGELREATEAVEALYEEVKKFAPSTAAGAASKPGEPLGKADDAAAAAGAGKPENENDRLAKSDDPKDAIKLALRTKGTVGGNPIS